jgi:hypothetical protein
MKNQKGMVTVDYLVAMVLVAGFSGLILALSVTLTVVETVQYITYSSARNFFAGNIDPAAQFEAGREKFNLLVSDPVVTPLFRNKWFQLRTAGAETIGSLATSGSSDFDQYRNEPDNLNFFHGTAVSITLNALDINIPLFGSTAETEQGGKKKNFFTYIGSYLGRETTFEECENFMTRRASTIKSLPSSGGARQFSTLNGAAVYIPSDNGC